MRRNHRAAIIWVLIVSMTLSPSAIYAQTPTDKPAGSEKPSLGYLTPTAVVAVMAFPRRVLTSPAAEMMPTEVLSAWGKKELGIDPLEIEQLLGVVEPPLEGPPGVGVVLQMTNPVGEEKIFPQLWQMTEAADLNGKKYQKAKTPTMPSIYRDGRTIIVANDPLLRKMLSNNAKPEEGKISKAFGSVATPPDILAMVWLEPVRPMISMFTSQMPVPPPLADATKAPDLISTVGLKANVLGDMNVSLTIRANDEAAAEQLEKIIDQLLATGKQMAMMQSSRQAASSDPIEQAQAKYATRMADRMTKAIRPVRNGKSLTLATSGNAQTQMATVGILVALLLPAVQAARLAAVRVREASRGNKVDELQPVQSVP